MEESETSTPMADAKKISQQKRLVIRDDALHRKVAKVCPPGCSQNFFLKLLLEHGLEAYKTGKLSLR